MSVDTQDEQGGADLTLAQLLTRGAHSHDAVLSAPSANDAAIQVGRLPSPRGCRF